MKSGQQVVDNKFMLLFIVVLILNIAVIGYFFTFIFSKNSNAEAKVEADYKESLSGDLMDYNRKLAQNLGVQDRPSVKEALAGFSYEIDLAKDGDELSRVIFNNGRQVQETILREWDALFREKIIDLINLDENLKKSSEKIQFTLQVSGAEGAYCDPELLEEETLAQINALYAEGGVTQDQVFRIEAEEGRSRMLIPYNPLEYIQTLTDELDALRVALHETRVDSGLAEMVGPGVVIRLYDAQNEFNTEYIIHDSDVRDMVNELLAAGAKGVSIGGQRLIATSPIRCVGPVIRVNQKEIPANPVVIEAVGDPAVLSSGLDIIRFSLEFHRNFRIEIEEKENIVLSPYRI